MDIFTEEGEKELFAGLDRIFAAADKVIESQKKLDWFRETEHLQELVGHEEPVIERQNSYTFDGVTVALLNDESPYELELILGQDGKVKKVLERAPF